MFHKKVDEFVFPYEPFIFKGVDFVYFVFNNEEINVSWVLPFWREMPLLSIQELKLKNQICKSVIMKWSWRRGKWTH